MGICLDKQRFSYEEILACIWLLVCLFVCIEVDLVLCMSRILVDVRLVERNMLKFGRRRAYFLASYDHSQ